MALDEMIRQAPRTSRLPGRRLADAMMASDLLGRYHVVLEAEEAGFEPVGAREFKEAISGIGTEISDDALPPADALDFFRRKQVLLKANFEALAEEYRPRAFTIAHVEQLDLLQGAKGLLQQFIEDDRGLEEFRAALGAMFNRAGVSQLNPGHVETVYRTNMATAYNAGRWKMLSDPEIQEFFPLVEYHAILDDRTRPTHRAMDGTRLPQNHPWWAIHWPPNGWNCRCQALPAATDANPRSAPLTTTDDDGKEIPVVPDPGFHHNPGTPAGKQIVDQQARKRSEEMGIPPLRTPEGMVPEDIMPVPISSPRAIALAIEPQRLPSGLIPEEVIPAKIPRPVLLAGPPPLKFEDFDRIGPQGGSNPGGIFQHRESGEKWYIKTPASEDIARNEVLAAELYRLAGIEVPELRLIKVGQQQGLASKFIEGLEQNAARLQAGKVQGIGEGFAVDAWLANWDVVGLEFDNLLVLGNRVIRVDTGGALRYRAQGGLKGARWGDTIDEIDSLRNPGLNPQAASVFSKIKRRELEEGIRRVLALNDDDIRKVVEQLGPLDEAERAALFDRLITRKQDLAQRFPKLSGKIVEPIVEPPADIASRISDLELQLIEDARANGYSIAIDKLDIEDHNVLFWSEKAADGTPRMLATFKVREALLERMERLIEGNARRFDDLGLFDQVVMAIKGIAKQASVGAEIRQIDIDRVNEALETWRRLGQIAGEEPLRRELIEHFSPWLTQLRAAIEVRLGGRAIWVDPGDVGGLFAPFVRLLQPIEGGVPAFAPRAAAFERKRVERGFLTGEGQPAWTMTGDVFEATTSGGGKIRYWSNQETTPFAFRGRMEIAVPGAGREAAEDILDQMERLGLSAARATALDREELYLRQIAWHRRDEFNEFNLLASKIADQQERVNAMQKWLSEKIGIKDIKKLPNYRPEGTLQAFMQGRRMTYRPDIRGKELEGFQKDYRVFHQVTGEKGLEERLNLILNGGGMMAPTTDRLRRGIRIGDTMSPDKDLNTGGASYFFTRIMSKNAANRQPGIVWKARPLARLDAISYNRDAFGDVTSQEFVLNNRKVGVKEWRETAERSDNETIFKDSLSLFDDLDRINAGSAEERDLLLALFRRHKINQWPDGRALEEVIKVAGSD